MEIWLDSANCEAIGEAAKFGVLHGVTTSPSVIASSKREVGDLLPAILQVQHGFLAVQVTADAAAEMVRQAKTLRRISSRILIKIPVTAEGLKAIFSLSQEQIPTMAIAVFATPQALLAARAGAQYIVPYYSRICEEEMDGVQVLHSILRMIQRYGYPSKILAASLKTPEQVKECCEMGFHAATLSPKTFTAFVEDHPLTMKNLSQ